jgi:threonine-phosphate decarboxylase
MKIEKQETHGGNIYKASEILNRKPEDIIDFSANINPLGVPEEIKVALLSNMDSLVHYPDPDYTRLRSKLAEYTGIPVESIVAGNGSSEIIFLVLKALKPKSVLIAAPSFSEYERASVEAGIKVRFMELKEEEGFKLNIETLKYEIEAGAECIFLCNPNNPTSTLASRDEMRYIIEIASRSGVTVIVDEAFIELTLGGTENSIAGFIKEFDNLFVIRAFTKAFAVPGLRLGYGMGNEGLIKKMRLIKQPWSVNSLAACAADFLPVADEYLKRTQSWLRAEQEWLYKSLGTILGLKVFEPQTNFILAKLPDNGMDAEVLKDSMAQCGILIRNASGFRFLGRRFFRIAIRDRHDNEILIRELSHRGRFFLTQH